MPRRSAEFCGGCEATGRFDASSSSTRGIGTSRIARRLLAYTCKRRGNDVFPRRRDHRGLGGNGPWFFWQLRRQRPIQSFDEGVEFVSRRAFESDALKSQTIQEHAAIRRVKRKKIWAAKQVRALRIFFLERFRILAEESRRVHFAVEMQARYQNELLRLFVFEDGVAIALPSGRQILRAFAVQELLQDFLPAKLAHYIFIELRPVVAEHFLKLWKSDICGCLAGPIERRMENLLRGNRRLLEHSRQSRPSNVSHDGGRKIQSANIGKD